MDVNQQPAYYSYPPVGHPYYPPGQPTPLLVPPYPQGQPYFQYPPCSADPQPCAAFGSPVYTVYQQPSPGYNFAAQEQYNRQQQRQQQQHQQEEEMFCCGAILACLFCCAMSEM